MRDAVLVEIAKWQCYITNCGMEDERIYANLVDFDPHKTESYFLTVIVT